MPEKISIMNPREKQVYTWFLVVVLVLFCLATYISRFNPLEVLWEQGEFWKFLFQDFLPPRFNASPVVVESILVTFALAVSSSFVAAVFAFLFAVFGSTSLSPWKGLARTIRGTGCLVIIRKRTNVRRLTCCRKSRWAIVYITVPVIFRAVRNSA